MITITEKGDYSKVTSWLERIKEVFHRGILDKYGEEGVAALSSATPVNTGVTANSWNYEISNNGKSASITFTNSNINEGVNIAIILQYGHGTGTGGYVQGIDYINPAIRPVFDQLAEDAWKEITTV